MKNRALFLLFAFMIILPVASNAQVGGLLKNKMNKVINAGAKTANKEVDNQIDTAVNKEAEKAKAKGAERTKANKANNNQPSQAGADQGGQEQAGAGMGKLFGNKIDLKYKEDYSFTSRIYMVTEVYDKKDVTKMDFFMFYSSSSPVVGIETKTIADEKGETTPITAQMVMDGENKSFLMLTDMNGMKMGMISEIPDENTAPADGKSKKTAPPKFTKTGNTRVIVGYKCDEYTYINEDKTTGKVWFTKDAKLKIDKRGWSNSSMKAYYGNPEFNDGILLANEAYDDKGKLTTKSETKEINENFPYSISVKGYTLRQMNMGQKDKK
jgi:hypothetical protein